jgi:hypothetical protein
MFIRKVLAANHIKLECGMRAADGMSIDKHTARRMNFSLVSSVSARELASDRGRERKKEMKTFFSAKERFFILKIDFLSLSRSPCDHLSHKNRAIVCFQLNLRNAGVDAKNKKNTSFYGNFIHSIGFPFYRLIFQLTSYYHCRRCRMHISTEN